MNAEPDPDTPVSEAEIVCAEITAVWGYGSRKDMQSHEAHLCEECYDEIVATFAIPPDIIDSTPVRD